MYALPQRPRNSRLPGARSFYQTEAAMADNQAPTGRFSADPYLDCRFSPFARIGTRGAPPDGRGKNLLQRDWKSAYNVIATVAGCSVRIAPVYPTPVRFYQAGGGTLVVNNSAINGAQAASPGGVTVDPGAMANAYVGPLALATEQLIKGRIVSVGYRLTYTGPAASATGLFIADEVAIKIDGYNRTNGLIIPYIAPGGVPTNQPANTVSSIYVDTQPMDSAFTPTNYQVVVRPENGIQGVLRMSESARSHTYKPYWEQAVVPLADNSGFTANQVAWNQAVITGVTSPPGVNLFDDDFMEAHIVITDPGSYRLEVVFCLEQELAMRASHIDMAKPSPLYNEATLLAADRFNEMAGPRSFQDPLIDLPNLMGSLSLRQRPRRRRPAKQPKQRRATPAKRNRRKRQRQRRAQRANCK